MYEPFSLLPTLKSTSRTPTAPVMAHDVLVVPVPARDEEGLCVEQHAVDARVHRHGEMGRVMPTPYVRALVIMTDQCMIRAQMRRFD
jgi:hypothetical protein